ncbi:MAG: class I SAM-dependent methyltransferase [Proteobacteria bacterium]|nr:class I SAM-dependent methyltransferase [Pseudomonadota bacterium]
MSSGAERLRAVRRALPHPGAWALRKLLQHVHCGTLTIVLPDGREVTQRGRTPGPDATMHLHRWRTWARLLVNGDMGFAEAYMDGDWSSPDLAALIELAARNQAAIPGADGAIWPVRMLYRWAHRARDNTRANSRRNIAEHYDLGNDFYAKWLDAGMSYSSALYRDPGQSLEDAQTAKQDRVMELLDVQQGHRVLEIGCGWGGLAERLAAAGCEVTAVTLSQAQHDFARARLERAGLAERAEVRLQDYRDIQGSFDRIVSIEMLEAVGEAWWPAWFGQLRSLLKPGGVIVFQTITIDDARYVAYRSSADFIQRYIFPGGMLPSPSALRTQIAASGFSVETLHTFGDSYARTLRDWQHRFQAAWPEIAASGFPARFKRMWEYYLSYCEGGFRAGSVDVGLWRLGHA